MSQMIDLTADDEELKLEIVNPASPVNVPIAAIESQSASHGVADHPIEVDTSEWQKEFLLSGILSSPRSASRIF